MYHSNRIKYLILFVFIFFMSILDVEAIVSPTNRFYINDYANIISDEVEDYIFERSVKLHDVDGTQIVVVTVPNLDGESLESYSNTLFNEFGIGDKDKDNGLLLLLALDERKFRVEVGYGLEGILPDGKTGRFQDEYIIPYLKNNEWNNGIKNGYDAFYKEIVELNDLDIDYTNPIGTHGSNTSTIESPLSVFLIFIFAFTGVFFGLAIRYLRTGNIKWTFIYLVIVITLIFLFSLINSYIKNLFGINLFTFLYFRFFVISDSFGSGSSGSGFSSGGFSGGGGSSRSF